MGPMKKRGRRSIDEELEETPGQIAGLFLLVIGGAGTFLLAVSPWDWVNAVQKILGIIASAIMITGGGILLQPPTKRRKIAEHFFSVVREFGRSVRNIVTRNQVRQEEW